MIFHFFELFFSLLLDRPGTGVCRFRAVETSQSSRPGVSFWRPVFCLLPPEEELESLPKPLFGRVQVAETDNVP